MTDAPDPIPGTPEITVDLGAVRRNYRRMAARGSGQAGAAVKADAYGCGMVDVAPVLYDEGCRTFFVALLSEGVRLRAILGNEPGHNHGHVPTHIYVLDGLAPHSAPVFRQNDLRPVLGSMDEVTEWLETGGDNCGACALHVDTGMTRLGLRFDALIDPHALKTVRALAPDLLMTHMACADTPKHPLNTQQIARFQEVSTLLPGTPTSLANSASLINGWDTGHAVSRPGIALYGGRSALAVSDAPETVVTLHAPILQVRDVKAGETVGYGASWTSERDSRIAVVAAGYADGYQRAAGNAAIAAIGDQRVPVVGRVSMDLTALDVTDLPDGLAKRGMTAELLGPNVSVDDVADAAGTIGYEILTQLSRRALRR
ncbi:MAG: alanine racemase, partial [Pseudomonadota bacterium]